MNVRRVVAEAQNTPGVKVAHSLAVVVVTDGIPFAQGVVQQQHIDIALTMLSAILRVVVDVQRLAAHGSTGKLAQHLWRGIEHWLWRKANGVLKRTQVYNDFLR